MGRIAWILAFAASWVLGAAATAQTPISTPAQLQDMRNNLGADYVLVNDIDCAGFDAGGGTGFDPVGSAAAPFTGTLDGQGFTIRNLLIQRPQARNVGLFGVLGSADGTDGAVVQNVKLEGFDIAAEAVVGSLFGISRYSLVANVEAEGTVSGLGYVGVLGGSNAGSTITDCRTAGSALGDDSGTISWLWCGGLVGANWGGQITRCSSSASVRGDYKIGGLTGDNTGTISESFATGDVTGWYRVGGFIGNNLGVIQDCYATGSVVGSHEVAGFVGLQYQSSSLITRCYSTGPATGGVNTRGFLGLYYGGALTANFWDVQTSGLSADGAPSGTTGLPTVSLQTQSTFTAAGWDFGQVWTMVDYPRLTWERPDPADLVSDLVNDVQDLVGNGTLNNGQGNSLKNKLQNALAAFQNGNLTAACNLLVSFVNQVSALLSGGILSPAQAQALLQAAGELQDAMGCP